MAAYSENEGFYDATRGGMEDQNSMEDESVEQTSENEEEDEETSKKEDIVKRLAKDMKNKKESSKSTKEKFNKVKVKKNEEVDEEDKGSPKITKDDAVLEALINNLKTVNKKSK